MRFGLSIPLFWRRSATGLALGRPPAQTGGGGGGLRSDEPILALFWMLECVSEINFAYA